MQGASAALLSLQRMPALFRVVLTLRNHPPKTNWKTCPDTAFILLRPLILLLFFPQISWHKCGHLGYSIFPFNVYWNKRTPRFLFDPRKAQNRITHALFYKGKVFGGVIGIESVRMKMRLERNGTRSRLVWVPQKQSLAQAFTQTYLKPGSHFIPILYPRWNKDGTSGNKTKRLSRNETAKENRTDFCEGQCCAGWVSTKPYSSVIRNIFQ